MARSTTWFIFLILGALTGPGQSSSIFPGDPYWTDTRGIPIQAHGGGFLVQNNTYFWFGEDKTEGGHLFHHVNCYKSVDLVTWEYLGAALSPEDDPSSELTSQAVVERPKVIYNAQSNKYVMWFHLDSSNYGLAKLGVAIADRVQGPYKYLGSVSPFDEDSRDMTVWVDEEDPNKTAYLVYATRVNLDTVIARLSPDYLEISERLLMLEGIHREAYAVFKKNGLFYMVMSRATGWDPNANEYMFSTSMSGPWSERMALAPASSNTFESQANYVIPVGNGQFIYAGDRWNRNDLSDSSYVWLPIEFQENNQIIVNWSPQFTVDITSGQMSATTSTFYDEHSPEVQLSGNTTLLPCSGCESGEVVGYIGLGGTLTIRGVSAGPDNELRSVLIVYANGDSSPRYATLKLVSQSTVTFERNVTFPRSGGGQQTKQILVHVPLTAGLTYGLEIGNELGYGPDIDYVKIEEARA